MGVMAIPLPTPWSAQADWSPPGAAGDLWRLRPCRGRRRFRSRLVLAAAGRCRLDRCRHPGVPPHRALCRLAADRRRHARDDAERHRRPRRLPDHHRGGEGGGDSVWRCCASSATALPGPVQSGPGFLAMFVVGVAHGLYPDLHQADSLRSLLGSVAPFAFAFSRLSPRLGPGDDARHRLDSAGVRGRRCGASACRAASGFHRQLRRAPGRAWPTGIPRRLLPGRDLCLPDRALPGRQVRAGFCCWRRTS